MRHAAASTFSPEQMLIVWLPGLFSLMTTHSRTPHTISPRTGSCVVIAPPRLTRMHGRRLLSRTLGASSSFLSSFDFERRLARKLIVTARP